MNRARAYIRLPFSLLSATPSIIASTPQDEDELSARQLEFIQHLFGYCAYIQEHGDSLQMSDVFVRVLTNLINTLHENMPAETIQCVMELQKFIRAGFYDLNENSRTQQRT